MFGGVQFEVSAVTRGHQGTATALCMTNSRAHAKQRNRRGRCVDDLSGSKPEVFV
jgi:hypothetical protein